VGADEAVGLGIRGQGSAVRVQGAVVQERPAAVYEVLLDSQHRVLAHVVGEAERNFVRLVAGDRVEVELMPYDPTRGRIRRKL
jgi:translation initiation factor IF-1